MTNATPRDLTFVPLKFLALSLGFRVEPPNAEIEGKIPWLGKENS